MIVTFENGAVEREPFQRISFWAAGQPRPMGEMKAFMIGGVARVVHAKKAELKAWQAAVMQAARAAMNGRSSAAGPVAVALVFYLPRPKGHYGKRGLLPSAPLRPGTRPDLDHYIRSTLDALTLASVFVDDSLVVRLSAEKRYLVHGNPAVSMPGSVAGAVIAVEELA